MTQEGFLTDLRTTELFFRVCKRYGVEGKTRRLELLRQLVKRKQVHYLRDAKEYLTGKKVLVIKKEPKK